MLDLDRWGRPITAAQENIRASNLQVWNVSEVHKFWCRSGGSIWISSGRQYTSAQIHAGVRQTRCSFRGGLTRWMPRPVRLR